MKKLYLILLLAIEIFALNCTELKDLKQYNGHYYAITNNTFTFDEAKKYAEDNSGYLAIPNDSNENIYLKSLIGGGDGAWIGIYDSSYSTNYCYSLEGCTISSNYKDIKNNILSYTNWDINEPNNYVHSYDVSDGKQMVSLLGEHWGVLNGNNGKWNDFGNHINNNNNPARFRALIEFDIQPSCYQAPTNITDSFTNSKCNTQLYDSTTNIITTGITFDCKIDQYNNTYCPSALSQCGQNWDYENGYITAGIGQVIDYTNKVTSMTYTPADIVLQTRYITGSTRIGTVWTTTYSAWTNIDDTNGLFIINEIVVDPLGRYEGYKGIYLRSSNDKLQTRTYGKGTCIGFNCTSSYSAWTNIDDTNGFFVATEFTTLGDTTSIKGIYLRGLQTCTNGTTPVNGQCATTITQCPDGTVETTGSETSLGQCKRTQEYTYYNYLCNNAPNAQGYNFTPITTGGDTVKTDPDNTIQNDLTSPLNNPTPPINNCKRQKYTCQANADRPCSFVDNSWQCSPFPCIGGNDVTPLGTIEGSNDKKNDGWNESGGCSGQIYIFNGNDKRCRDWDMFFGLTGGGCCDKEKVFAGIIACKDNEKALAKLSKAEQCHEVGEYCSKEAKLGIAKICVQKSKSNCCFGSKLARAIHEQGRPQINMSWGSAESPQCRGFKPEEFQKLDFSKIDLSGTFDIPNLDQTKLNTTISNTITNFKNMLGN